jgi:hypothetical protein
MDPRYGPKAAGIGGPKPTRTRVAFRRREAAIDQNAPIVKLAPETYPLRRSTMLRSHGRFPYSAFANRPSFTWPEGRRTASDLTEVRRSSSILGMTPEAARGRPKTGRAEMPWYRN